MAIKDFRSSLNSCSPERAKTRETDETIERFFYQLACEMGMNESDLMLLGDPAEQVTIVYDKFAARLR